MKMETPQSELNNALRNLQPHDHLCLIYESYEEWRDAVLSFIGPGLEQGERWVYISDAHAPEQVREVLRQGGVKVDESEKSGQLVIAAEGISDPDKALSILKEEADKSLAEGRPALRVTIEISQPDQGHPDHEPLLEYESKLGRFLSSRPCISICQYDRGRLDPEAVKGAILTHPLIIQRGKIYSNSHYIPHEELSAPKGTDLEVQHLLDSIACEKDGGPESQAVLREMVDLSGAGIWSVDRRSVTASVNQAMADMLGYGAEEMMGRPATEFMFEDDINDHEEEMAARQKGVPGKYERRFRHKDGTARWMAVSSTALKDGAGRFAGSFAVLTDITQRKKMEDGLAVLASYPLLDPNPIVEVDPAGRVLFLNPTARMLFPDLKDCGKDHPWLAGWDSLEEMLRRGDRTIDRDAPVGSRWYHQVIASVPDSGAVRIYGLDITERMSSERALRDSERKYQALIETTGDFIWETDSKGRYTYCSPQMKTLWGIEPEEMIGRTPFDVMPEGERESYIEYFLSLAMSPAPFRGLETTSYDCQGRQIFLETSGVPFFDDDGKLLGFRGISRDITERKMLGDALKKSEAKFKGIYESSPIGIEIYDQDGRLIQVNRACMDIFGVARVEDVLGFRLFDDPNIPAGAREMLVRKETVRYETVFDFERVLDLGLYRTSKSGTAHIYAIISPLFLDGLARPSNYIVQVLDITEQKQAEAALRKSEERLMLAMDAANEGMWDLNIDTGEAYFSPRYYSMLGYEPGEFPACNKSLFELMHPDDVGPVSRLIQESIKEKRRDYEAEYRLRTKKGDWCWILSRGKAVAWDADGKPRRAVGTHIDTTERKNYERALEESENKYRNIFNNAAVGIFQSTPEGRYISVNPALARMFGFTSPEEMISEVTDIQSQIYTNPEDRVRMKSLLESQSSVIGFVGEFSRRDGKKRWISINAKAVRDGDGRIIYYEGTTQDTTQKVLAESNLREQLNFLQQLIDAIPGPIFFKDRQGRYLGCNKAFESFTGLAKERMIGKSVYDLYPKDLADVYFKADNALFADPGVQVYEAYTIHADGTKRVAMFNKAAYFDMDGRIAGLVGVILDISERKKMEEALEDSERRLADIINFLPDATLVIDRDGRVIAWNQAMEAMTGIKAEEMLGRGDYEYALPFYGHRRPILIDLVLRSQEDVERIYCEIERKGSTLIGEAYMPNLKGGRAYLWGAATALYDFKGNVVGAIESIKDITDRKRSEDLLKASLQEKDVLLKEIHHRVKNNLQIISSLLSIQASYLQVGDARRVLEESQGRVKSMALVHESLYKSDDMARVSFANYIKNHIGALLSFYNVDRKKIRARFDLEEVILEINQAIPCGLVLNELITNSLKYAFPGDRKGEICIELHSMDGEVLLAVKDDGIGLPEGFELKSAKSMGLRIVNMLVKQLKGTMEIDTSRGTEFRIRFAGGQSPQVR